MQEKPLEVVPNRSCLYDGAMGYIEEIYDRVEPDITDVLCEGCNIPL